MASRQFGIIPIYVKRVANGWGKGSIAIMVRVVLSRHSTISILLPFCRLFHINRNGVKKSSRRQNLHNWFIATVAPYLIKWEKSLHMSYVWSTAISILSKNLDTSGECVWRVVTHLINYYFKIFFIDTENLQLWKGRSTGIYFTPICNLYVFSMWSICILYVTSISVLITYSMSSNIEKTSNFEPKFCIRCQLKIFTYSFNNFHQIYQAVHKGFTRCQTGSPWF